jgi:indole-3-acetate monooxygenase
MRLQKEIGRFSSELFGAIRDAGLFSLWVPKDFGGPEIPIKHFMFVMEALARADASVSWCAANASTNSVLSGYLPGQSFERFGTTARAWWPAH